MKTSRFIYLAPLAFMAVLPLHQAARAASATWNGTTDALWSSVGNWSASPVPGVGNTATFNNAGNSNTALTVGTISISNITFDTSSAAAYTLGSGTIAFADGTTTAVTINSTVTANEIISANLTLGSAIASNTTFSNNGTGLLTLGGNITGGTGGTAAAKIVTVTGTGNTTISGVISNGGATTVAVTKTGTGTLLLTNTANTFTGVVTVSGGTLRASDGTVYGAGDQNITTTVLGQAASNGINFAANATAKTLDLRYNGQNDSTAQKLQLLNSKGGNLLVNASSTNSTINVDRESGTGTNKTISFFNTTIANGAVLAITGGNGYSLGLGTLAAGTGGGAGNLTISPTTANVTVGNVNNAGTTGFAHTLILDGTSGGNTITGIIANSTTGGGVLSVTKQNTGNWTLSGASTYTGATTVSGGTLALGAANRIADTSNLIMAGGTFATGGFNETLGTLTLSAISTIDLGSGASALVFADSSGATWGSSIVLSFVNFNAGVDTIRIGTTSGGLTLAQIGEITINGSTASIDSSGFLSIAAIPEPSTWGVLIGTAALVGTLFMRRSRRSV